MNAQLSDNNKAIMTALVAGPALSKDVAAVAGLALPVVTGSLAGLKKNGFVEVLDSKELKLTEAGIQILNPPRAIIEVAQPTLKGPVELPKRSKGDRKAAAVKIVESMPAGSKRADIVKRFMSELGMSAQGASTYHYMLCGQRGKWKTN